MNYDNVHIIVVMREIEERNEFLVEMQSLGTIRQYEALIQPEIADKPNELERLQKANNES